MNRIKKRTVLLGLLLSVPLVLYLSQLTDPDGRKLLVIVDMEPDDRIALMLLAVEFPQEMVLIGTTGMHAGRKAALSRQLLDQLGLAAVPVFQGSGGEAESYPEISSSGAARNYRSEGNGLLPESELEIINRDTARSSRKLSLEIRESLLQHDDLEIVLLAPATDLVHALDGEPSLQARIKHIHLMGGWSYRILPSGTDERRTTYNWNMDPEAAAKLMSMKSIPMTLYSSDVIKNHFSGGSVNREAYPAIIGELENRRSQVPAFESFLLAANSWDHHLMEEIPPLRPIIGNYAGQQFTPADPVVAVGVARADLVTRERPVDITIDLGDLDPARGFRVVVEDDPVSRIILVEAIDPEIFRYQVLHGLQKTPDASSLFD